MDQSSKNNKFVIYNRMTSVNKKCDNFKNSQQDK